MKNILFIFSFLFIIYGFSQSDLDIRNKSGKPCYYKSQEKAINKYMDFDCSKIVGAVDCNEKLEYQEQDNRFFSTGTGAPFNGECVTCHQNGVLEHHIRFENGREEGTDTTYYYSGCPMVYRTHVQGLETGTWTYFYDSTQQVAWVKNYFRGVKTGQHIYFDNKGDTTVIENYKNDLLDGKKKLYYTQNKLKKIISYKKGIFDGPNELYNLEGKLIQVENYKAGKKNGEFTYYYDDGALLKTEKWSNNVKNGSFKTFFHNGDLMTSEYFNKGIREGVFEQYYSNKQLKKRAVFLKGALIELREYDEYGAEINADKNRKSTEHEDDKLPSIKKGKTQKNKRTKG